MSSYVFSSFQCNVSPCIYTLQHPAPPCTMPNVHRLHCGEVWLRVGRSDVFCRRTSGKGVLTGWEHMSVGCGAKNVLTFLFFNIFFAPWLLNVDHSNTDMSIWLIVLNILLRFVYSSCLREGLHLCPAPTPTPTGCVGSWSGAIWS